MIQPQGSIYVDILHGFRNLPNPGSHYLAVDGHPDARGYEIFTHFIAEALTDGTVPALTAQPQKRNTFDKARGH